MRTACRTIGGTVRRAPGASRRTRPPGGMPVLRTRRTPRMRAAHAPMRVASRVADPSARAAQPGLLLQVERAELLISAAVVRACSGGTGSSWSVWLLSKFTTKINVLFKLQACLHIRGQVLPLRHVAGRKSGGMTRRGRRQTMAAARPPRSAAGRSAGSRRPPPGTGGSLMTRRRLMAPARTPAVGIQRSYFLPHLVSAPVLRTRQRRSCAQSTDRCGCNIPEVWQHRAAGFEQP